MAGESVLWVDSAEIPAADDVDLLGKALSRGRRGDLEELMANTAAYSGLRWGELTALGTGQVDTDTRVITVGRKVVEVAASRRPPRRGRSRAALGLAARRGAPGLDSGERNGRWR